MKQLSIANRSYVYDEKDQLGKGGFGTVYKGKINGTDELVAIKTMNRATIQKHQGLLNQVGDEVNILQRLLFEFNAEPCPFIVRIYDCFEVNRIIYVVMEYCDGGSLYDLLE